MKEISELDREISDAIGQRNMFWHMERLGKFTSSKFEQMMKTGRAGTSQRRKRIEKAYEEKEISYRVYQDEIKDIEQIEYNARFGDGCRTYVFQKIAEIMTQSVHETGSSFATEWGNDQEDSARKEYENRENKTVLPCGFIKFGEFAGGSPDGKVKGENGIIEIKCPFDPANHVRTLITNEIPAKYFYQVHGNIMITDSDYCDFISYDPRMQSESLQLVIIRVERDEKVIQEIQERIKEVADFMRSLITENTNFT